MSHRPEDKSPARASRRAWFWPALVVALLAGHLTLMLAAYLLATSNPSFSVEPDYYDKAQNWDREAALRRASQRLGWKLALSVLPGEPKPGWRVVQCRLSDADGRPIVGAVVEVVAFHHARGSQRLHAVLSDQGDGRYTTALQLARPGLWEFRLRAARGDDVFVQTRRHELPAAAGRVGP